MSNTVETKTKWYNRVWLVYLLLLAFWPVGVYAFYKSDAIAKWWKITVSSLIGLFLLIGLISVGNNREEQLKRYTELHENLKSECSICWQDEIKYLDSIKMFSESKDIDKITKTQEKIYYDAHVFELTEENFITRGKYYTGYIENIDFKTKTITFKKEGLVTEIGVHKEIVRKSLKYFTDFPELNELNIVIYRNENEKTYTYTFKSIRSEFEKALPSINWYDFRNGRVTAGDFGYEIPKSFFKYSFSKKKIRYKKHKLNFDFTKIKNNQKLDELYSSVDENEIGTRIQILTKASVKVPSSLEFYAPKYDTWSEFALDTESKKYIDYDGNEVWYKVKFRSQNLFGVLVTNHTIFSIKPSGSSYTISDFRIE